jgi:hypothetical protein
MSDDNPGTNETASINNNSTDEDASATHTPQPRRRSLRDLMSDEMDRRVKASYAFDYGMASGSSHGPSRSPTKKSHHQGLPRSRSASRLDDGLDDSCPDSSFSSSSSSDFKPAREQTRSPTKTTRSRLDNCPSAAEVYSPTKSPRKQPHRQRDRSSEGHEAASGHSRSSRKGHHCSPTKSTRGGRARDRSTERFDGPEEFTSAVMMAIASSPTKSHRKQPPRQRPEGLEGPSDDSRSSGESGKGQYRCASLSSPTKSPRSTERFSGPEEFTSAVTTALAGSPTKSPRKQSHRQRDRSSDGLGAASDHSRSSGKGQYRRAPVSSPAKSTRSAGGIADPEVFSSLLTMILSSSPTKESSSHQWQPLSSRHARSQSPKMRYRALPRKSSRPGETTADNSDQSSAVSPPPRTRSSEDAVQSLVSKVILKKLVTS